MIPRGVFANPLLLRALRGGSSEWTIPIPRPKRYNGIKGTGLSFDSRWSESQRAGRRILVNEETGVAQAATTPEELQLLNDVLKALSNLSDTSRERVLNTVLTYYKHAGLRAVQSTAPATEPLHPAFGEEEQISPKQFLFQKQPKTDVERVACLAYYLTYYRDIRFFKTLDLTKLNTEAAQRKFANATWAVNNATLMGYLVAVAHGQKQISAAGEQFVNALPNRDAAKAAMSSARPKRKPRRQAEGPTAK